ncbi:response regulator [Photobacterium sp. OFAV2-7]|uniref:response regulator n=1 Tax=Photobacterium sp. OFAV2-7 TaxID=2917748 RepID=UPI001EF6EAD8|nr:response regulator [Photobacterium sp. OFAV2-7]MCG7587918.1 response regulator [Photobacterium sp. OFAV2-7]
MDKKNILIVEDEANIAEVLIAYCENEGFRVTHLSSGQGVVEYVKENSVDLMLLDLMLPHVDGLSICKEIRSFSQLAIIMVTAKHEEIDRLLGLEFGADDYICKPFSPREVVARIKAVLRRFNGASNTVIKQSGFTLEPDKYKLSFKDELVELTPIEFKIFELLLTNVERVFTRDNILNRVYSDTTGISDRNIDTHIKNIRKKINIVCEESSPIASVYGVGYKFKG